MSTKEKKPIYKKAWLWVLAAVIIGAIYAGMNGTKNQANETTKSINISQRLSARFQIILTRQLMAIFKLLFQDSMPVVLMSEIVLLTLILLMPMASGNLKQRVQVKILRRYGSKKLLGSN